MRRAALVALFCIACAAHGAEPLGRLFYTPAQRAQLDVLRSQKNVAPAPADPETPAAVPEVIRYDGIVRRSDGKTTIWINSRAIADGKPAGDLPVSAQVRGGDRLRITVPQAGRSLELKVGQSAEVLSGSIMEPYAQATSAAKPSSPPGIGPRPDAGPAAKAASDDENERHAPR